MSGTADMALTDRHYDYTLEAHPDGRATLVGWSVLTLSVGDGITIGDIHYRVIDKNGPRHLLEPTNDVD